MEGKILILAVGGLGDLIRVFPLLVSLKKRGPGNKIFLLTSYSATVEVFSLLRPEFRSAGFYYWPLHCQNPLRRLWEKIRVLGWVRSKRFDLLCDTSRGTGWKGNYRLGRLSGAKIKVGFSYASLGKAYDFCVPFALDKPLVEQNLALLSVLGLPAILSFGLKDDFPSPEKGKDFWVLHPGAQNPERNPPVSFWKKVIKNLKELYPQLEPVIIGGPQEASLREILRIRRGYFGLRLEELAGLIRRSRFFIGVDSGPLHLAVALQKPTVGLFGPTCPLQVVGKWPFFEAVSAEVSCAPCYRHLPEETINCRNALCIKTLSVEALLEKIQKITSKD